VFLKKLVVEKFQNSSNFISGSYGACIHDVDPHLSTRVVKFSGQVSSYWRIFTRQPAINRQRSKTVQPKRLEICQTHKGVYHHRGEASRHLSGVIKTRVLANTFLRKSSFWRIFTRLPDMYITLYIYELVNSVDVNLGTLTSTLI
jgi:hypothetical protein